ncbi:MAG: hypothetical protein J6P62_05720 [Bacteroidales bacterium]|nr:hypothetical protein [Bacteroidales bacterium]
MIIEMKFDSEYKPDQERLQKVFRALGLEGARDVKTCADLMETARRRSAGEQVIYRAEPKASPRTSTRSNPMTEEQHIKFQRRIPAPDGIHGEEIEANRSRRMKSRWDRRTSSTSPSSG